MILWVSSDEEVAIERRQPTVLDLQWPIVRMQFSLLLFVRAHFVNGELFHPLFAVAAIEEKRNDFVCCGLGAYQETLVLGIAV